MSNLERRHEGAITFTGKGTLLLAAPATGSITFTGTGKLVVDGTATRPA